MFEIYHEQSYQTKIIHLCQFFESTYFDDLISICLFSQYIIRNRTINSNAQCYEFNYTLNNLNEK